MSEELIAQIEKAFVGVEYPGENYLTSSTYGDEPEALKRSFSKKDNWRTLDSNFLDQAPEGWASALSFFSDQAFVFYLPAYLIADLRGELSHVSPDFSLCYGVAWGDQKIAKIWGGGTIGEHARQRFALFTTEQVAAIVSYLWWKLNALKTDNAEYEDPDITQALENYWLERNSSDGSMSPSYPD